ncbi:MAG: PucR family transcriptional regulator [Marmoricola sp.]
MRLPRLQQGTTAQIVLRELCDRTRSLYGAYSVFVPISVSELLEMPHLRLTLHSGESGLDRAVSWTHTTDLPEPWHWVAGGELLMTNGMSMPRSAAGQEELVRQLVEHGATALAIGAEMYAPPLTKRLGKVSDELSFPVLWVAFPMPFVSISRTVAEATLLEQSQRLIRTERIYRALQLVSADKDGLRVLTGALSRELDCPVMICERESGGLWAGDGELEADVRAAVKEQRGRLRAGVMASNLNEDRRVLMTTLPTHADALLVCLPRPDTEPDAILLQHAATVCALGISQARLTIEHERRAGAEMLVQILDGSLSPAAIKERFVERGIDVATAVIVAARGKDEDNLRELHLQLWRSDTPHLTVHRTGLALSVVGSQSQSLDSYVRAVGHEARIGISDELGSAARIGQAEKEARWALDAAEERSMAHVRYAEAVPDLGPRTPEEADAFVRRVLQGVLSRSESESAELMTTLSTFLDHDRSWQRAAQVLHVHRQTVLYRIRKVEQLTGLRVSRTADLATLWVALRSWERRGR